MSPGAELTRLGTTDLGAELEPQAHGARDETDKAGVPCRHCFGSAGIVAIGRDGEKTSGHDLCPVTAKCFHHLHAIVYHERGRWNEWSRAVHASANFFFFSIMVYIQQFTKMDGSWINDKVLVWQPPLITSISTRKYSFAQHKHIWVPASACDLCLSVNAIMILF